MQRSGDEANVLNVGAWHAACLTTHGTRCGVRLSRVSVSPSSDVFFLPFFFFDLKMVRGGTSLVCCSRSMYVCIPANNLQ